MSETVINSSALLYIFVLAVLIEGVVEYLGADIPAKYKKFVAAGLSIIFCLFYNADLLAAIGLVSRFWFIGPVLTGLVIGRGSNYLAIIFKWLQVVKAPAQSVSSVLPKAEGESHDRQVIPTRD